MREPAPAIDELPWRTRHELRFADMDRLGHINNGAFGSLMESNRTALVFEAGISFSAEVGFAIARFEIDYLSELNWPGTVEAASGVEHVGTSSMRLRQALFSNGACAAAARCVVVAIDMTTRRPTPIPASARAVFERWPARQG